MATIKEQAAAIKGYAAEIDAAIVNKGGTTAGGLRNAAAAIEAIPSGGGEVVKQAWFNDGGVHIWFKFLTSNRKLRINLRLYSTDGAGGSVFIDWGNGETDTRKANASGYYELTGYKDYDVESGRIDISGVSKCTTVSNSLFASNNYADTELWSSGSVVQFEVDCVCSFSRTANTYSPFQGCSRLKWVRLNLNAINTHQFYGATALEEIELVSDINAAGIPEYSFQNCALLKSVDFTKFKGISSIGTYAFSGCASLSRMVIPEGVTTMASSSFANCVSLEYVCFPSTISSMNYTYIFRYVSVPSWASKDRVFEIKATTPPPLYSGTLNFFSKVIVPKGAIDAYKAATNWSAYSSKMVEAED